ncbi:MAG: PDR/VanB family oxidoreductase [Rhodococcus sp. (in: high G+C Gram-positive bacteria)]|jgi:ferredoxin-NADP reductase
MRGLRRRWALVTETVESFRQGRTIPPDLYGRAIPDQTVSLVTDALDKWFALLDRSQRNNTDGNGSRCVAVPVARTLDLTVSRREVLCVDEQVVRLTFTSPQGTDLPAWAPGMHLDVHLPSGRRRQYSLCGDPADRSDYTVAVRLIPDGGGGSQEMHRLEVGTEVRVRGPRNGFPFVPRGQALFIAGGIGITAILPMVRAAQCAGMDWQLLYCGRSRESMPFVDEIEGWGSPRVRIRTDDVDGHPTPADLLAQVTGGAVYCCGPPPMISAVRTTVDATAATHLYFERFSPPPVTGGVEFEVQLVDTGDIVTVAPDQTALDAIRRIRPDVAYSCQQGFCGTCRTRVLAGTPEHRDTRLTPEEQHTDMLICVSRATGGRIVLDL